MGETRKRRKEGAGWREEDTYVFGYEVTIGFGMGRGGLIREFSYSQKLLEINSEKLYPSRFPKSQESN